MKAVRRRIEALAPRESAPFDGVWRCSECGELREATDPRWRWTGEKWQHHHGYPVGHVDAECFGAPPREGGGE